MEAPQMRGVEEPLLPEPRAVEGGATQSEGTIETQVARYPRLHQTAGLRGLDVCAEISNTSELFSPAKESRVAFGGRGHPHRAQASGRSPRGPPLRGSPGAWPHPR